MDEETQDQVLTEAELEEVKDFYRRLGVEEKGIDTFFLEIIRADDTTKIGNLTEAELGSPNLPVRTLKELAGDCELIPSMATFTKYFKDQAEMILATSLSKEGFLIKARITQKKELLDRKRRVRTKGGLFAKKVEEVMEE